VHLAAELTVNLKQLQWTKDLDISEKSATSLQVTQLSTSTSTENIIPGQCEISINVRFSHNYTVSELQQHVGSIIDKKIKGQSC
jgi:succinyl-diaminopimelate desuccinylase